MGPQRFGLVALAYALVLLTSVVARTSSDSTSQGCIARFLGDGDCDLQNNNEECDYDGGDCCECTCVSSVEYTCGENGGYACIDPSAPCVDNDDVTELPSFEISCITQYIADGDCDAENNFEECGFDGGDCCECTCVDTVLYECGDASRGGFDCLDPSVDPSISCDSDDDVWGSYSYEYSYEYDMSPMASDSGCLDSLIRDGNCDSENNSAACGYDGGDCCECDCDYTIGLGCHGFDPIDCVDPSSSCVNSYDGP